MRVDLPEIERYYRRPVNRVGNPPLYAYSDGLRRVSMLRILVWVLGLILVAIPRRIVETAETVAFDNPEDAVLRGWTIPMARFEGIGYLLLVRRTGFISGVVGMVFGLVGSAAAVAPRRYLDFGLSLAYENPDDIAVKSWVIPMTRVLGFTALVLTVKMLHGKD